MSADTANPHPTCTPVLPAGQARRVPHRGLWGCPLPFPRLSPAPVPSVCRDGMVTCEDVACAVDCGWSAWSPWTRCDGGCGMGTQERFRCGAEGLCPTAMGVAVPHGWAAMRCLPAGHPPTPRQLPAEPPAPGRPGRCESATSPAAPVGTHQAPRWHRRWWRLCRCRPRDPRARCRGGPSSATCWSVPSRARHRLEHLDTLVRVLRSVRLW